MFTNIYFQSMNLVTKDFRNNSNKNYFAGQA